MYRTLIIQDCVEERTVNQQAAFIIDEPELAEFGHEVANPDLVVPIIPASVS